MAVQEDRPNTPPRPENEGKKDEGTGSSGGDIIGKASGFNYTQRWGSRLGQKGVFNIGGRPPAKADWDQMSPEEREAVGITDWNTYSQAHEAWQKRHATGGDIYDERTKMAEAIVGSGATTWDQVKQALLRAGFSESIHEQGPMFKQLQMAFEGNSDPSGRYHWTPNGWVDVSTSDLAKRGIAGAADYTGGRRSGMDAIYGALPQTHDIRRFQQWLNDPKANASGLRQHYNAQTGMYGTGAQQYDQFGNLIDVATGKRVGHYYPGDTRQHYGGGGSGVDWGEPTMAGGAGIFGGGGGGMPGGAGGGDMNMLLQELARMFGIQLPQQDLTPQIIPGMLAPGQPPQVNGSPAQKPVPVTPQPAQPAPTGQVPQTGVTSMSTTGGAWGVQQPQQPGIYGAQKPAPAPTPQPQTQPRPQPQMPQPGIQQPKPDIDPTTGLPRVAQPRPNPTMPKPPRQTGLYGAM